MDWAGPEAPMAGLLGVALGLSYRHRTLGKACLTPGGPGQSQ